MVKVTGIIFKAGGKLYYFSPGRDRDRYEKGMGVVVETSRGYEYGTIVIPLTEIRESELVSPLKPIARIATERDRETVKKNAERRQESMRAAQEKARARNLDMKIIDCEFAFDGSKVAFFFTAPQRVDFKELVKDLSSHFKMRVELWQVGIRDEIKMLGGISPCGRECCCSSCMPDIKKVSIKMAKTQGLSLNPAKISGLCGRLMCCLGYENDYYAEAGRQFPKLGASVGTPDGKGIVVNINMLKMQVRVRIEDKQKDIISYHDYKPEELKFRRAPKQEKDEPEEELSKDLKEILD